MSDVWGICVEILCTTVLRTYYRKLDYVQSTIISLHPYMYGVQSTEYGVDNWALP